MDYGEIISRAWRITWNNKYLWVLGFLAALTSAGSSGNSFNQTFSDSDFVDPNRAMQLGAALLLITCIFMLIGLMLWLLSVAARGGLVAAVDRLDNGEKMTLGEAFSAGVKYIWRVIGVYLLIYLPVLLGSALIGIIVAAGFGGTAALSMASDSPESILAGSFGILFLCLCLLFCILIPVFIVLAYIAEFGVRAAIVDDMRVTDSIRQGWRVIKENAGAVILLAVLMFVISLMVGFVVGIITLPLAAIILGPMLFGVFSDGSVNPLSIAWLIGGGLCLGIFSAALTSVVQIWYSAVWTLAYKELTGKKPEAIPADKSFY